MSPSTDSRTNKPPQSGRSGLMVRCELAAAVADRLLAADDKDETTVTVTYPTGAAGRAAPAGPGGVMTVRG